MEKSKHPIKLIKARTQLLIKYPFFGQLALKCDFKEGGETMATDGKYFYYNREFIENLPPKQVMGVLVHEILHNAFLHAYRIKDRDPKRFNIAADYAINGIIIREYRNKLELPDEVLYDPKYVNMSAEKIYTLLPNTHNEPKVAWGEVLEATDSEDSSVTEQEAEWKVAVKQAANMAKKAGDLPKLLERRLKLEDAKVNWKEVLQGFVTSFSNDDYSWYPPDIQYLCHDLHVPSMSSPSMGPIVIAVDTSGSINLPMLSRFFAELSSIIESCKPKEIHVLYCDSKITGKEILTQYDLPLKPHPIGGGGTAFKPVFDYVKHSNITPDCLIYFTDLYGDFPEDPGYPVLWARTSDKTAPFGAHIDVE